MLSKIKCATSCFKISLSFQQEIKEDLLAFSKLESLHNVDSLIVVLMSHGSDQFIVGTDNQKINVLDLVKLFNGDHCPAMINKPKLFLINACRGGEYVY